LSNLRDLPHTDRAIMLAEAYELMKLAFQVLHEREPTR
jgi:hypothetical protein